MIKIYCDRCGKEIDKFNQRRYAPVADAANGDDKFLTISIYTKVNYKDKLPDDFHYDYCQPELCVDCMREINDAVKTVWDGVLFEEKEG